MLSQLSNRNFYLVAGADALAFVVSLWLAYALRFDFGMSETVRGRMTAVLPFVVAVKSVVFFLMGAYRGLWRYTSLNDGIRLVKASALASGVIVIGLTYVSRFEGYPRSVFIADSLFTAFFCGGIRLAIRLGFDALRRNGRQTTLPRSRLMLVGADDTTQSVIKEIHNDPSSRYEVVCCVDDDARKSHRTLHGVPIRGPLSRLPELIVRFRAGEVLVAIKSLDGNRMLDIVSWCKKSGIPCRTVPSFGSVIDGHVSLRDVRDVAVEDLLGREPVRLDDATVREALRGNCALITGAGGSIGSELARQAAAHGPSRLVLFEMGETPLFEIERELRSRHPNLDIAAVIGDMRHKEVVDRVFQRHRPQHVYHAAAYKHVPLMEEHPDEAVLNNVRGTRHLVEAALRCGVKRFVMISSDKAVRPGNVMGATKRLCELYIEAMNGRGTDFVAVRFGNVLGSSGSVVPIFMKHIATRTPLPVTHPEATRFFMTIPEAARLVLHCGTMNREQGVFVLEMGQPVKIMDLARKMIRLSGLTEGSNIAIEIIGLRPGEKLHEELEAYGENLQKTDVPKINVLRQTRRPVEPAIVTAAVRRIEQMAASHDADNTRRMLMRLVEFDEAMQGKNAPDGSAAPDEESVHRRWEELLMPDGAKC